MDEETVASIATAQEIYHKCRALSQRADVTARRMTGETDALAVEVKSLLAAIKLAEKAAKSTEDPGTYLAKLHEARDVIQGFGPGGDLRRLCNPKSPVLLRLLLGSRTNFITLDRGRSVAMKEEYHKFRNRAVFFMFVAPLLLTLGLRRAEQLAAQGVEYTLTPLLMTGVQFYLAWLSYFYLAMAIRENVLLLNGSHIRSWWIHHHYWSAVACLIMLSLPVSSPTVLQFCESFLLFSCFQAVVMALQNHYQRRRMYTRIALGKNSAMDVVTGESSGSSGQLLLLYPLLFLLQSWQFFVGVSVASNTFPALLSKEGWLDPERTESDLRGMRGIFVTGCIFAFLAVMNFSNTLATIVDKRRYKKRKKAEAAAAKSQ